jgi:5-methylthioadenosine/S-adenosylhomocysteine deaminase
MKFILHGTIVTLDSRRRIISDGYLGIEGSTIAFVSSTRQAVLNSFKDVPIVDTNGYIYPGLTDLHNHLPFNFLPLWNNIQKKFVDRYQWQRLDSYKREVKMPADLLALTNPVQLAKYAEVKALVGGVTTIDGWSKFSKSYASWLLRNVELEPFGKLEGSIYQSVPRLFREKDFTDYATKMQRDDCNAFIYHLAEGTSTKLYAEYEDLKNYGLIGKKLVGIHCTALNTAHFKFLGTKKARLVWSPLSNLLLYGSTAKVIAAKKNGILISLGSDWSPTGSKNLLWELKVADLVNKYDLDGVFSDRELVEMVTINPAKAIGWDDRIGLIAPGHVADIVVFDHLDDDPYRNLILSTEKNLKLSIINGKPRLGDPKLLSELGIVVPETFGIKSRKKGIDILEAGIEYGNITLRQVKTTLRGTMRNPQKATTKLSKQLMRMAPSEQPLRLIIEDDSDDGSTIRSDRTLLSGAASAREIISVLNTKFLAGRSVMPVFPKDLDALTMHDDKSFFATLKNSPNIPDYLDQLRGYLN